jgi:cell division protein ZapE
MTDYRQDRLAGNPVYFWPLDKAAGRALNEIWRDLTHGREEELVLEVKGRAVHLPRYWAGMARCTFWELCGQPLGPADYLSLVGAVKLSCWRVSRNSTRRNSTRPSASSR